VWNEAFFRMMGQGLLESLYMTLTSTALAYVLGLPLAMVLVVTSPDGIRPMKTLYRVLDFIVNMLRSLPFLILLIAIIPLTRFITGTTLGPTAMIVPLVLAATPFVARLAESSLQEVDKGVIEAAQAMGAGRMRIVLRVLLPEAASSLLTGAAIAVTTILGYSAMAGIVGAGGLGAIAINYGYYRRQLAIMYIAVVLLLILVQVLQTIGMSIAKSMNKK
jgi:D-methionine transport system permease protein